MDNKLITSLKNVISIKNIDDFIKEGEEFHKQFCIEIIEYSKNNNIETIKNILIRPYYQNNRKNN